MRKIVFVYIACALGLVIWMEHVLEVNKEDFESHLLSKYDEQFDVKSGMDFDKRLFAGAFKDKEGGIHKIYKVRDNVFLDNYYLYLFEDKYENYLKESYSSIEEAKVEIDEALYYFYQDKSFEEAIDRGLEYEMRIELKLAKDASRNEVKELESLNHNYLELTIKR